MFVLNRTDSTTAHCRQHSFHCNLCESNKFQSIHQRTLMVHACAPLLDARHVRALFLTETLKRLTKEKSRRITGAETLSGHDLGAEYNGVHSFEFSWKICSRYVTGISSLIHSQFRVANVVRICTARAFEYRIHHVRSRVFRNFFVIGDLPSSFAYHRSSRLESGDTEVSAPYSKKKKL